MTVECYRIYSVKKRIGQFLDKKKFYPGSTVVINYGVGAFGWVALHTVLRIDGEWYHPSKSLSVDQGRYNCVSVSSTLTLPPGEHTVDIWVTSEDYSRDKYAFLRDF